MQLITEAPAYIIILLAVYALATIMQLFYYWFFFARFAFFKAKKTTGALPSVSVVISAKNEFRNLKNNLPDILNQDYPEFEVVVVNDASNDETSVLLEDFAKEYPRLNIVKLHQNLNFFSGKKFPLSLGIRSAKHDVVLLTDADCKPASSSWIREMAAGFTEGKDIVLGFGAYKRRKGFLNRLIRFDTLHIAIQYLSFAISGNAFMGVGRNMAYRKSLFYEQKGFTSHYKVASGDDDLFINSVANKTNTAVVDKSDAHTFSKAADTIGKWFRQKRRHLTTGKFYKTKYKILLGFYAMSQILFYGLFIALMFIAEIRIIVLSLFAVRLISQLLILKKSGSKLNEKDLLVFSPLLEIILIIVNLLLGFTNLFVRQNKWK